MHAKDKVAILLEAINYISLYEGKIIVVKYGGNAMAEDAAQDPVFEDMALLAKLGLKLIIVHGGGPRIDEAMQRQGIVKQVVDGLRVTDATTLGIVIKVLGVVNRQCVKGLQLKGIKAEDCTSGTLVTRVTRPELGYVGEVVAVNTDALLAKLQTGVVPVVSSLGRTADGQATNINADTAAAELAVALKAEKLTILTNVDSVLDAHGQRINQLKLPAINQCIADGTVHSGMIPKVLACAAAVRAGVKKAHLINGTEPRALLLELFTQEGLGTEVVT